MAAVEADHARAVIEQRGKLDELPFAVGQAERRQNLCLGRLIVTKGADFGHLSAEAAARKSEI
jgi:hypothetical protein